MIKKENEFDMQKKILDKYHRFILHMRQRSKDNMLTLCFGAGISKYWQCPTWEELVLKISQKEIFSNIKVNNEEMKKLSVTAKAQILFEQLKTANPNLCEDEVIRLWIENIHSELYAGNRDDLDHPYLKQYLNLIINSPVTINYNFDDYIEQMVYADTIQKNNNNLKVREYETVWMPSTQFKRKKGVIYHPNGYIPKMLHEGFSEHFVFTENSYADQLLDSMYGHYNTLFGILSRYTTLFIGHSLNDPTLKHLLHHNAKLNPGHYHYFIYYIGKDSIITEEEKHAIQTMYFNVYNLLVMFMTDAEIKALGCLIDVRNDISLMSRQLRLPERYRFYISGIPGSGKTTVLNHFKMMSIHTEWPEKKIPNLDVQHDNLCAEEVQEVDDWINNQFEIKNNAIYNDTSYFQIIDRSLIDPLAFKDNDIERTKRAEILLESFTYPPISDGHLILLDADGIVANNRLLKRNSNQRDVNTTNLQRNLFKNIFGIGNKGSKATVIDTSFLSIEQVVKRVGEIMFFKQYIPINYNKILEKWARKSQV